MNSLNIDLEKGQKVVMGGEGSEEQRTVTVIGGFGQASFTSGTALFVELPDGTPERMSGLEIEKIADQKEKDE